MNECSITGHEMIVYIRFRQRYKLVKQIAWSMIGLCRFIGMSDPNRIDIRTWVDYFFDAGMFCQALRLFVLQ